MLIWASAATAAAIIAALIFVSYRRQISDICRRLEFLKNNKTNMRLTASLPFGELNRLIDGINEIIDISHSTGLETMRSEAELKEAITSLSHDIRTPLTSMDGYIQLLAQADNEEERRRYLSVILSRTESLKNMLEELFTYTKLQNESYVLPLEKTDFSACVFDAVFSFYNDFEEKGIEPEIDFTEKRLFIIGNSGALRRILQNIIKNALEHGKSRIVFSMYCEDGSAFFRCSNNFDGACKIDTGQVFKRFYKADPARTNSSTGLGLAIAKGLTEKTGGSISAEVKDSLFSVTLRFPEL